MDQAARHYPCDLTDQQWELIKDLIPPARRGGRPRRVSPRQIINAVFYLTRTGCAWRYLPKQYPAWQTVYDYFRQWRDEEVWIKLHQALAQKVRLSVGKEPNPNLVIIDGQSVKAQFGEERGWDGFKKVRGRKRQIIVDSLGIIWAAKVHRANQQESTSGYEAINKYPNNIARPEILLGDAGYGKAPFNLLAKTRWGIWPEIRKGTKPKVRNEKGHLRHNVGISNLKPQRWIVERSFAWFNHYRRLARDYERKIRNSETFLFLSQMPLLLNRLAS
jgi:putative transposase